MKRFLILAALTLLAASCGRHGDTFTVKGTITDSLSTIEGAKIVFYQADGTKEEVPIVNGKFSFTGKADLEKHYMVKLDFDQEMPFEHGLKADFIAVPGTIRINLNNPPKVRGGKLNRQLNAYMSEMDGIINDFSSKALALIEEKGKDAAMSTVFAMQDSINAIIVDKSKAVFDANSQNVLGAIALSNVIYDMTPEEFIACYDKAADFIRNHPGIQKAKARAEAYISTAEGRMFTDFEGTDAKGNTVKLSDYVGKGQPVLVDFWASWCGPCKEEIPNIKAIYEEFGSRGLTVLGVPVWDGDNSASRRVMDELGMEWDQIFTGEDTAPTDSYGIDAIPHIILFGADGTILKRDLRGEQIKTAVEEALASE